MNPRQRQVAPPKDQDPPSASSTLAAGALESGDDVVSPRVETARGHHRADRVVARESTEAVHRGLPAAGDDDHVEVSGGGRQQPAQGGEQQGG